MSRSTTSFRLSRAEAKLIRIGLLRATSGHCLWNARGRIDEGEYSAEHLAIVLRVIVTATGSFPTTGCFTAESRRVRLDPFELAACLLAVPTAEMMVRHGHTQAWLPNHKDATRRLLVKLERLRKRAKRAFIRVRGPATFTEASQRWQGFVRFARVYFLFCGCNRPRLPGGGSEALRKPLVQEWILYFREELPASGIRVPGDQELRDLVRRALRSARRFTADMGLMTVRENGEFIRDRIKKFVTDRCRNRIEDGRRNDPKRL